MSRDKASRPSGRRVAMKADDKKLSRTTVETAAVVLSWFVLNIAIGSSTKWIYLYGDICIESEVRECHPFKFPLTITFIHMVFSWGMCHIQLNYVSSKPRAKIFTIREQLEKIAPLSLCTAVSIAMGNLSLKYIYPSFNQMLGAMSPIITVGLAVLWQGKRFSWWTWGSMPILCGGLALCSIDEVNFNALGAFYAAGATVLRSVKSIMQGKLLQGERVDSVTLLYYMAPWASLLLLILACINEGAAPLWLLLQGLKGHTMGQTGLGEPVSGGAAVLGLLMYSGLNACLLNVANFSVTSYTSPITLQVLGNVKSCLAIAVSVAIFRNELQFQQAIGVAACLFGVWLYQRRGGEIQPRASAAASLPKDPAPKDDASPTKDRGSSEDASATAAAKRGGQATKAGPDKALPKAVQVELARVSAS